MIGYLHLQKRFRPNATYYAHLGLFEAYLREVKGRFMPF